MPTSVKQMLEAANAVVPKITPDQAAEMIKNGNTLVLDVRDAPEVAASGKVAGAVHVSRGMLEFRADPESPYHDKNFDKDKAVILYCASGGRAALAGKLLKDMGYNKVYNVGGFKDWTGAVDKTLIIFNRAFLLHRSAAFTRNPPSQNKTAGSFDPAVKSSPPNQPGSRNSARLLLRRRRRRLLLDRALQLQRARRQHVGLGLEQERIEAAMWSTLLIALVETRRRTLRPSASEMKVTLHRFGRNRRLVLMLEWLTLWPTRGPLAVSSQRRDIVRKSSCHPASRGRFRARRGGRNSCPFRNRGRIGGSGRDVKVLGRGAACRGCPEAVRRTII